MEKNKDGSYTHEVENSLHGKGTFKISEGNTNYSGLKNAYLQFKAHDAPDFEDIYLPNAEGIDKLKTHVETVNYHRLKPEVSLRRIYEGEQGESEAMEYVGKLLKKFPYASYNDIN